MTLNLNLKFHNLTDNEYHYNFYEHGVTQSMIGKWLECPYQCKLEYVDGWIPRKRADYFLFGDCAHHVFENVFEHKMLPTSSQIDSYLNSWLEKVEPHELKEANQLLPKIKAVVEAYFMKYPTDFMRNWWGLEYKFKETYTFDDGVSIPLRGMIDMVENIENGDVQFYDTKNLSMWKKEDAIILLPADLQLNFYGYVLSECKGLNVTKAIYNVIKKPMHRKGGKSDEAFYKYIKGKYLEDLDNYFHREAVNYTRETARNWKETQLDPILKQMRIWADSNYKWPGYYNPKALENKYGLAGHTRMILDDDMIGYVRKKKVFEEL